MKKGPTVQQVIEFRNQNAKKKRKENLRTEV